MYTVWLTALGDKTGQKWINKNISFIFKKYNINLRKPNSSKENNNNNF